MPSILKMRVDQLKKCSKYHTFKIDVYGCFYKKSIKINFNNFSKLIPVTVSLLRLMTMYVSIHIDEHQSYLSQYPFYLIALFLRLMVMDVSVHIHKHQF